MSSDSTFHMFGTLPFETQETILWEACALPGSVPEIQRIKTYEKIVLESFKTLESLRVMNIGFHGPVPDNMLHSIVTHRLQQARDQLERFGDEGWETAITTRKRYVEDWELEDPHIITSNGACILLASWVRCEIFLNIQIRWMETVQDNLRRKIMRVKCSQARLGKRRHPFKSRFVYHVGCEDDLALLQAQQYDAFQTLNRLEKLYKTVTKTWRGWLCGQKPTSPQQDMFADLNRMYFRFPAFDPTDRNNREQAWRPIDFADAFEEYDDTFLGQEEIMRFLFWMLEVIYEDNREIEHMVRFMQGSWDSILGSLRRCSEISKVARKEIASLVGTFGGARELNVQKTRSWNRLRAIHQRYIVAATGRAMLRFPWDLPPAGFIRANSF